MPRQGESKERVHVFSLLDVHCTEKKTNSATFILSDIMSVASLLSCNTLYRRVRP